MATTQARERKRKQKAATSSSAGATEAEEARDTKANKKPTKVARKRLSTSTAATTTESVGGSRTPAIRSSGSAPRSNSDPSLWAKGGRQSLLRSSGFSGFDGASSSADQFDCESSVFVWKRVKPGGSPPEPRFGHAQALGRDRTGGDGYLFVFGGGRETLFDDCHVLNLQTHKWQPLECGGHQPPPRSRHTATRIDQQIVIYGGTGWGVTDDVYVLDLPSQEWDKVWPRCATGEDQPGCRKDHTLTAIDASRLVLFGGAEGSGALKKKYNDVFILEKTPDGQWIWFRPTVVNPDVVPPPTSGHSAVWDETTSRLIVFGGEYDDRSFCNTIWILSINLPQSTQSSSSSSSSSLSSTGDTLTDLDGSVAGSSQITVQWTRAVTCGTPPQPLSSHSCFLAQRNMFVFGGWCESVARTALESSAPTFRMRDRCSNNVSVFHVDTLHWTHMPQDSKLKWPAARAAAPMVLVHPTHALLWSGRDAFNTELGTQICYDDLWQLFVRPPLPPEPPAFGRTTATQVQLKWNTSPGVRRFRLEMSAQPGAADWNCIFVGFSNQFTCPNLQPATQYFFRIAGWNPSGWGPPSAVASQTTPVGTVPGPMKPPTSPRISRRHLRLCWTPPEDTGGCAIESYVIQISQDGRLWDRKLIVEDAAQHQTKISNLQPSTTYHFRIAAANKIGVGKHAQLQVTTVASEPKLRSSHEARPSGAEPSDARLLESSSDPALQAVGRSLSSSGLVQLSQNEKLRAENEALKLQVAQLQNQVRILLGQKESSDAAMSWNVLT